MYLQTLDQLASSMFALDHNHNTRWLPVHIRDMKVLKDKHSLIQREFQDGKFVVQKSYHIFSLIIALDKNHEQENESVKGVRGAIGLTENPCALQRWMISGLEVSRTVKEFERSFLQSLDNGVHHHEKEHGVQLSFAKDVKSLIIAIEEFGSPFMEDSPDLLVLDTKDIMPEPIITAISTENRSKTV